MASTIKAFRKCVDPCPRLFDTRWHTRLLRLLFGYGARTRCPWGGGLCALWAALYEEAPLSPVLLFEERGAAVCFPRFKTHRCRGTEENEIVGFAGGSSRWVRERACLSHESAKNEGEPLDYDDVISLTSSDPAASALLGYAQEEQEMSENEDVETELSQTSCPAYEELLDVMERATARLAVGANQNGGAARTPWWAISFWP